MNTILFIFIALVQSFGLFLPKPYIAEIPEKNNNVLKIHFEHDVDGKALVINDIIYQNESGNQYSVITLKYLISEIELLKKDGSSYKIDTFHYRDIAVPYSRTLVLNGIPNGEYTKLRFRFGLSKERNKSYGLPNNQMLNNFEWPIPMGGGYHFMKFEGRYITKEGKTSNFNTHTGSLKTRDNNYFDNSFLITIDNIKTKLKDNTQEIILCMNLNEWFKNPHVYDLEKFGSAIMGNQQAQQTLKENGQDVFKSRSIQKASTQ